MTARLPSSRLPERSEIDKIANSVINQYGAPGIAVAVSAADGAMVVTAGNRVAGQESPIQSETAFPIGCIIKPLLSLVCLQLAVDGQLDLDRAVDEMIPELASRDQIDRGRITLRHLLSHTAGFREPQEIVHGRSMDWSQLSEAFRSREQLFAPGLVWSYSQTGHIIIAELIQRSSGYRPWELIKEWLLKPLGISLVDHGSVDAQKLSAVPHVQAPTRQRFHSAELPSEQGLFEYSTSLASLSASDLLTIAELFGGRKVPNGISADAFRLFMGARAQNPGPALGGEPDVPPNAFGLGLARYGLTVGHSSSLIGVSCALRFDPRNNVAVVVCLNSGNSVLCDRLARGLLQTASGNGQHLEWPIGLAYVGLDELEGHYRALMLGMDQADIVRVGNTAIITVQPSAGPPCSIELSIDENGRFLVNSPMPFLSIAIGKEPLSNAPYLLIGASAFKRVVKPTVPANRTILEEGTV